jgi:hypothetical protein
MIPIIIDSVDLTQLPRDLLKFMEFDSTYYYMTVTKYFLLTVHNML